jgi:protein-S-isoprenylcysteine O-methyltransferase Ste14
MMPGSSSSDRGAGWVWGQFGLIAVILALGAVPPRWPDSLRLVGIVFILAGLAGFVWAARTLGRSFTAYPRPLPEGVLVEDGPYRLVRHPVYGAGLLFLFGYGLLTSVLATAALPAIAILWWLKSNVEERHLAERFPAYDDYRRRVRRRML